MIDNDQSLIKLVAAEEAKSLVEIRSHLLDEHTHSFRWLTASLLAINAGGAVAALNSEYLTAHSKILSGAFFGAGLLSTLLFGVFSQWANRKYLPIVQQQIGYWISVIDDGERDESMEADFQQAGKGAQKIGWAAPVIGWISALLFMAGIATMGLGLKDHERMSENSEPNREASPSQIQKVR